MNISRSKASHSEWKWIGTLWLRLSANESVEFLKFNCGAGKINSTE